MATFFVSKLITLATMVVNRPMFNMGPIATTIAALFEHKVKTCASFPLSCGVNQFCMNSATGPICTCVTGYEMNNNMCQDIDECAMNSSLCWSDMVCENTLGSHICNSCPKGYKAVNGECKDIDECFDSPTLCGGNALCSNTLGGYVCNSCPWGFLAVNRTCQDIDECSYTNACILPTTCINLRGSYRCQAPQPPQPSSTIMALFGILGYTPDTTGVSTSLGYQYLTGVWYTPVLIKAQMTVNHATDLFSLLWNIDHTDLFKKLWTMTFHVSVMVVEGMCTLYNMYWYYIKIIKDFTGRGMIYTVNIALPEIYHLAKDIILSTWENIQELLFAERFLPMVEGIQNTNYGPLYYIYIVQGFVNTAVRYICSLPIIGGLLV
eukprot:Ihof_evm13s34 gene=Ihof_evmTU13s34